MPGGAGSPRGGAGPGPRVEGNWTGDADGEGGVNETINTLAARLRAARGERGWSQEYLAAKAGVSVRRAESGEHCPHPRTIRKIVSALGLPREQQAELEAIAQSATNERMAATAAARLRGKAKKRGVAQ